jgi:hypothetical protein
MRKPCLESYILESTKELDCGMCAGAPNFLKIITIILIDHIDPTKNDHCNILQVVIFEKCVENFDYTT